LHDLGKLGIPEPILFKPSRLTPKEYETVKEHVPLAGEILKTIHSLHSLIPMVLHHHERYDGSGYPNGLAAEDILIEGRILALADALDAMASDRPYRRALNRDEIIKEIQDNSGTQFDPELVAKILKSLETGGNNLLDNVEHEHLAAVTGLPTHSV
jgi:HD-GYP domain-containing protein (c-di-GMP phosphodiesterase class II)